MTLTSYLQINYMDNRIFSIQNEGREAFDLAMKIAFTSAPGNKATHFFDHPTHGFLLLWNDDSFYINNKKVKANKLPYAFDCKAAADLVWGWLQSKSDEDYKDFLDHDGSNGKGYKVYSEDWGHVAGSHYAFVGIIPIWAWYGK